MVCQEIIRLFQRRIEVRRVQEFWYMEVPSCTEWKINNAMNSFRPNTYVEVGLEGVHVKVKALSMYRGLCVRIRTQGAMKYILGLATIRGSEWGCNYAEAFETVVRLY